MRNIRRDEAGGVFVVNSSSRVCGLHFVDTDYHDGRRQRERQTTRQNQMLKQGSVPTKFDCFPERLRRPADDGKNKRKAPKERKEPPPKKRKEPPTSSEAGGSAPSSSVDTKESAGSAAPSSEPTSTGTSSTDDRHDHCECVEQLMDELARLDLAWNKESAENAKLRQELEKEKQRLDFCLDRFKDDDGKIRCYTGFSTFGMLMACYSFLLPSAMVMRTWQGKRTVSGDRTSREKCGPKPKLSLPDQFFMVLVRLRLGRAVEDLADCFFVSPLAVSRTFTTWINLIYFKFGELPLWMSRRKVDKNMPPSFRHWYPTTRVIIDATEFFIEKPSSLARQSATWSSYKNHNTFKSLLGISPDGTFTYISDLYEGSISDVSLVEQCGLLGRLERGDSVMADKGFEIQHLLSGLGVRLNIPPFRQGQRQFTPDELLKTKKIAAVRIHVERAIQRLKQFKLLTGVMPNTLWDVAEQLVFVAAVLCNFQPGLAA